MRMYVSDFPQPWGNGASCKWGDLPTTPLLGTHPSCGFCTLFYPGVVFPLSLLFSCPTKGSCPFLPLRPYLFSQGTLLPWLQPPPLLSSHLSLLRLQFFSNPTWVFQGLECIQNECSIICLLQTNSPPQSVIVEALITQFSETVSYV